MTRMLGHTHRLGGLKFCACHLMPEFSAAPSGGGATSTNKAPVVIKGRKARVIDHRGGRFTDQNIDGLMARRHANLQARRAGHRTKGPRPFLSADREAFIATLERLLIER